MSEITATVKQSPVPIVKAYYQVFLVREDRTMRRAVVVEETRESAIWRCSLMDPSHMNWEDARVRYLAPCDKHCTKLVLAMDPA